jgi:hypothetical protein
MLFDVEVFFLKKEKIWTESRWNQIHKKNVLWPHIVKVISSVSKRSIYQRSHFLHRILKM